jgi:hypothetical protein
MTAVRPVVVVADHDDKRQRTMTVHTAHTPVDPKRWAALYVLCAGMPMIVLDVTIDRPHPRRPAPTSARRTSNRELRRFRHAPESIRRGTS